ncbi:ABC-type multidrug transport system fused ATPase/permease subunit [Krasilnikovia cinnamomea]|uniref:ABC-type multidrug transport system fused ATPase/permease subunit n=1 Tax=Krasilnikovia cinnamomea TaxID=349313 RepID=A0A4Q7ZCM7_9ACTN|nr:ABC transporter ATP-binding protein/permease [Krasilnikovia cinnamomea]RZU48400.1 ABC-type multidrug transport system fused ATPase/permease subunit [Krasilnikovia cinnamomea]
MRLLRDLWATAPRRTALVAALIVLGATGQAGALALAGPVLVNRSVPLFAVLAAALVTAVLTDLAIGLIVARLTADWTAAVRRGLCRVALGQDLPTLENTPVGELLDRIDSDVYQVGAELRGPGVRIAQSMAVATLSIVTAFLVWWPAAIAMVLVSGLLVATMSGPIRSISPLRIAEEEAWSDLAAVMEEAIHGQDDVRTSLAAPYVRRLYAERARAVLRRGRRVWRTSAKVTLKAGTITRALIAVLVVTGAWALTTGHVDGARLTAVWLLALGFGGTLEHVTRMVPELQNALGAWSRVQMLRDVPQEPAGGAPPADGDLIVRDLTFRYGTDPDRAPALREVSLSFTRGRSYALIGRTGSGKSTLAKVLTRSVEVPRGTVTLGGVDLNDIDIELLRRWTAIVPQRTEILAGTLAENIALFDPELLPGAGQALAELGLTSWVEGLPEGIDTKLGEGGHKLSAGQEQLVAFARILVRDPHVVILDEATARMDPVTEGWVHRATDRLLTGRIGVIVAHRLSSVRRCDEVVVLADGRVLEAGPLRSSRRFAELLAASHVAAGPGEAAPGGVLLAERDDWEGSADTDDRDPEHANGSDGRAADAGAVLADAPPTAQAPPLPDPPPARTFREIVRLTTNDPRYGLAAVALFAVLVLFGLDGAILPLLWSHVVDGIGDPMWPALAIAAALLLTTPALYYTGAWFPEWWVRQMLRISLRLVHGQVGPRRVSKHTPAEVVAQGGDTERVVMLADNVVDNATSLVMIVAMTWASGSVVPALFFGGTMLLSGLAATLFGPRLEKAARRTVAARAAFATALVSSLSAARTVKLAGATRPVLTHLARLDTDRSVRQRREITTQVWARSTPSLVSGLLPIAAWALYLAGSLSAAATLIAVATLGAARWFAWTTASLVSQLPSARVWTARTVAMAGTAEYSAAVPGVDISAGTAPAPATAPRNPLTRLELQSFSAVHENGTVGVHDVDLAVERGQLVLVLGPVGSGKSSLLRALAGIVHHTGTLRWNGHPVDEPELFLRPNQVGYVAQLPRVLSGTVADNIQLGHPVDAADAVSTAQLEHDLTAAGGGLQLLIGHKGTRLSGGQLQRLALARALAPRTELLIADDVSSALDVTTELELWRALRGHGVTVVGSTSKRAALSQADRVVVLNGGRAVAQGTWQDLEEQWGHLAG